MCTTKPMVKDFSTIMDTIERRLTACPSLRYTGRLELLINSVITPTTTYALCTFKIPIGATNNVDRSRNIMGVLFV